MTNRLHSRAFSITELTLVASGLGLLATFVLPFPQWLQQRQRLTTCLGNLSQIGAAAQAYAAEDARHQMLPFHTADVTSLHSIGWDDAWGWRTAAPHAFGGQTPTTVFPAESGPISVMLDSYWGASPNPWGAATRPLNQFIDGGDLQVFHCPADTGYPAAVTQWDSPDVPLSATGIACFEMLGNSYRANHCGAVWVTGGGGGEGSGFTTIGASIASAPFGHMPEYVLAPSRTVLASDPVFYSAVRELSTGSTDPICGWHGFLMADNVAYCDGSARLSDIGTLHQFSAQELQDMLCREAGSVPGWFLRRGPTWQMDCYPAPGAVAINYWYEGSSHPPMFDAGTLANHDGWPYDRFFCNGNPFGSSRERGQKAIPPTRESHKQQWLKQ
jgi:type II secretory pathway pseudopilin PulG